MSLDYTWEKLYVAVTTLAAGTDRLQDRLRDAYTAALIRLKPDDFPEDQRQEFRQLQARMNREPAHRSEGTITTTTRLMSDEDARRIAEQIVSLFDQTSRGLGHQDTLDGRK